MKCTTRHESTRSVRETRRERGFGLRSVGAVLLTAAVAATAALPAPAEAAEQEPRVLVGNLNAGDGAIERTLGAARPGFGQAFTTGATTDGYALGSLGIQISLFDDPSTAGNDLRVTVNGVASGGGPGDALCTLTHPSSFPAQGLVTFDAPAGDDACPRLAKETTYFAVIEWTDPTEGGRLAVIPQTSPGEESDGTDAGTEEDAGGAAGWSIADESYFLTTSSNVRTWTAYDETASFKMVLKEAAATTTTTTAGNNPATGAPTITGTAQVGQTLTASTSGIVDSDGLDNVSYSYQWIRNDGSADSDIAGATGSTYELVDADLGKAIKVRVSFQDDEGNQESLTSAATDSVSAAEAATATEPETTTAGEDLGALTPADGETTLSDTLTETDTQASADYPFTLDTALMVTLVLDELDYDADLILEDENGQELYTSKETGTTTEEIERFLPAGSYTARVETQEAGENAYEFRYGVQTMAVAAEPLGTLSPDAAVASREDTLDGVGSEQALYYGFTLAATLEVSLSLQQLDHAANLYVEDANATVLYASEEAGTTDEGIRQSLAAGTYYIRVETQERGANTYTLSYDASEQEAADESAVEDLSVLTPADAEAAEEDATLDFVVTLDPVATATVTVDYATSDGTAVAGTDYTATSGTLTFEVGESTKTIAVPLIDDTEQDKDKTLTLTLSNATGAELGDAEARGTIRDTKDSGAPTISGTLQVGETLTADTSGILDNDGLENATFTYRWWKRVGTILRTLQNGADATYVLEPGDAGDKIIVRVSFTDDAGNPEWRESEPTAPVAPASTPPATDPPAEESTSTTTSVGEDLGALTPADGETTLSDTLTETDTQESADYPFSLDTALMVTLVLDELDYDADLILEDENGQALYTSEETGTTTEEIERFLPAGSYTVRVETQEAGENAYTLRYGVQTMAVAAEPLGTLSPDAAVASREDTLDGVGSEQALYYGFTLAATLDVSLGLQQLDHAADLYVEDTDAEVLYASEEAGTTDEGIQQSLAAGTYYIRVETQERGENTYTLSYGPSPLTARFEAVPTNHDGTNVFTFQVQFSENPAVSFRTLRDEAFTVSGGTVQRARRVNGRHDLREIHIQPAGSGAITVTLAGGRACGTTGAICTADGRPLANSLTAIIPGPVANGGGGTP